MDSALTSHQLAEKAGIELEQARRIFQAARDVAALRLVGGNGMQMKADFVRRSENDFQAIDWTEEGGYNGVNGLTWQVKI